MVDENASSADADLAEGRDEGIRRLDPEIVRGAMERQQLTGGLHDHFTSQRQRESGSSRGEVDLTLIRKEQELPAGIESSSIESGDPDIRKSPGPGSAQSEASGTPGPMVDDPKTGGAGPVGSSNPNPAESKSTTDKAPRSPDRSGNEG